MNVSHGALNTMLNNIPDLKQRKQMADILTGQITHNVYCDSKSCDHRLVGQMYKSGKVEITTSEGRAWLRAFRHRPDGFMGFQCWCGNDSRLSEHEKDIDGIVHNNVTKKDLELVYERISNKPSKYPEVGGKRTIDGFTLEVI